MPKFRKLPVIIEAVQFTGKNQHELGEFASAGLTYTEEFNTLAIDDLHVHTLEGDMKISEGDWLIKGIKGEFYPCKADIFAATYEPVEEDEN